MLFPLLPSSTSRFRTTASSAEQTHADASSFASLASTAVASNVCLEVRQRLQNLPRPFRAACTP